MREGLHKIVSLDETIVAISTPPGRGAIGVIRLSGKNSFPLTSRFFRSNSPLEHRQVAVGTWCGPDGVAVDQVVVHAWRSPHSYTGEDLIEISAHGNPAVLERIVRMLKEAGARPAGPGEFTLRAVASGKMDLIQAEAVREFVDAQTERQARVALCQLEGAISRRIRPSKEILVNLIARLEAGIDFADDDVDLPDGGMIAEQLPAVIRDLDALRESFGFGKMLTEGASLAILGKPNVGKSSLFNRLLSVERSIVTEIPGTTRDVVTELVDLDGMPVRLADTAGIRETEDRIEGLGVDRTLDTLGASDLALIVLDGSRPLDDDDRSVLAKAAEIPHLLIVNKSDLPQANGLGSVASAAICVSALSGTGFDELRSSVRDFFLDRSADLRDDRVLTSARQNESLCTAIAALERACGALAARIPHEMVLLDLYAGLSALDELTGEVATEDVLDRIFSTFCIGK